MRHLGLDARWRSHRNDRLTGARTSSVAGEVPLRNPAMRTAGHDRWAIWARDQNLRDALFQRLQKVDEIADLTGIQPKLRHPWVARRQPFAQCVLQRFDRISLVKRSKWGRGGAGTSRRSVDRMAPRAIGLRKGLAAPDALVVGKCGKARGDG